MMYVHLKGWNKSRLSWDDHCKWGRKLHCFDRHVSSCCLPGKYLCCWCVSAVWEDVSMQAHACNYNTQHFITDGIVSAPATPSNKLLITDHTDTHQLWNLERRSRKRQQTTLESCITLVIVIVFRQRRARVSREVGSQPIPTWCLCAHSILSVMSQRLTQCSPQCTHVSVMFFSDILIADMCQ